MSKFMYFVVFIVVMGTAYVGYEYYLEGQEGVEFETRENDVSIEGG